jgi:aerobic carbon-monoxide dehydrogenase medium subunit
MKPFNFAYAVPRTIDEAHALLKGDPSAKLVAGGQTLGPMLNLRLVQPGLLIDITRIPELTRVEETDDGIVFGACVTHAAFEDGRVPDPAGGALRRVARGIAYRAVRTRGTIGGSLAHADPAADWISCLAALGAETIVTDGQARRTISVSALMTGVFETAMAEREILEAVRVPRLSKRARFGYHKICRKTGEFAEAIGAVLVDPERGVCRAVSGATESTPIVIENAAAFLPPGGSLDALKAELAKRGLTDAFSLHLHAVALLRAAKEARP